MKRIWFNCKIYANNKKRVESPYCARGVKSVFVRMFRFHRNRPKYTFRLWLKYWVFLGRRTKGKGHKQNAFR